MINFNTGEIDGRQQNIMPVLCVYLYPILYACMYINTCTCVYKTRGKYTEILIMLIYVC